jgi:hypothetical protein
VVAEPASKARRYALLLANSPRPPKKDQQQPTMDQQREGRHEVLAKMSLKWTSGPAGEETMTAGQAERVDAVGEGAPLDRRDWRAETGKKTVTSHPETTAAWGSVPPRE